MSWFSRSPPERPQNEPKPPELPLPSLLDHEERLLKIEARMRAMDVELEDFISKVSAAAKRAYKRDADAERHQEKEPEPTDRAARKAQVLRQLRQQRGG